MLRQQNAPFATRDELAEALEHRLGAWVTERAHPAFAGYMPRWHLALQPAALAGVLAFGPNRGARVTYVRLDQWVGKLPAVVAIRFLAASAPAIASTGMIEPKRPNHMAMPVEML